MSIKRTRQRGRPDAAPGFTLLEVMMTVLIFGIGMIAILSVFPVAGKIQRNTMETVTKRQMSRNVQAMLAAARFDRYGTNPYGNPVDRFQLFPPYPSIQPEPEWYRIQPPFDPDATNNYVNYLPLSSRSYPSFPNDHDRYSFSANAEEGPNDQTHVIQRNLVWVPLFRNENAGTAEEARWQVFVFLLKKRPNTFYAGDNAPNLEKRDEQTPAVSWVNAMDPVQVPGVWHRQVTTDVANDAYRIDLDNSNSFQDDGAPPYWLNVGDWVLGGDGVVYRVESADVDGITVGSELSGNISLLWFSPPPAAGESSPCQRILTLGDTVEDSRP